MFDNEKLILNGEIIITKYDNIYKFKEKFNIFEILELERKEVDLHSKIIYSLLTSRKENPLGKEFFEYFITIVLQEKFNPEDNYMVYKEFGTVQGRIDFYIENKANNFAYAIEMKIDAEDQNKQLQRYETFLKKKHKDNYKLYYLTLDGKEASDFSADAETNYTQISFKDNITEWLEKCLEKSHSYPMLRETIRQYLNSVNKISNNLEDTKKMELKELLLRGKNLRVAEEMSGIIAELKNEIEVKFWEELREKIKTELKIQDYEDFLKLYEVGNRNNPYASKEILFSKYISKDNQVLTFGLGRGVGTIYFFAGIEQENEDLEWTWVTKEICDEDDRVKENISKLAYRHEDDYQWEHINDFDMNSDDFYILTEEDRQLERKQLIDELLQTFRIKYQLIEELFNRKD